MIRTARTAFLLVWLVVIMACGRSRERTPSPAPQVSKETLMKTNRYLVEKDEERIRRFAERHHWHLTRSPRGFWYEIWHHGQGPKVTEGKSVTLNYTLRLLDGSVCYSSDLSGPMTFTVGHGGAVAGLDQAIRLMRQGDKARLILPPFLAYGVPGDRDRIPPRSVIVYELEVMEVK